jgi:hypothetical protein
MRGAISESGGNASLALGLAGLRFQQVVADVRARQIEIAANAFQNLRPQQKLIANAVVRCLDLLQAWIPSAPANAMRISNPPNPAIRTNLLSLVGMKPTRVAAIAFILSFPGTTNPARRIPRFPGVRSPACLSTGYEHTWL